MRPLFLALLVPSTFLFLSWKHLDTHELARMAPDDPPNELIFSHQYHIVTEELECGDCHAPAGASTSGLDNLLPAMEVCGDCHDVEDDDTCNTCHEDLDDPREVPRIAHYSEKFSHERHLGADLVCTDCHAEVAAKETVEPVLLPTMVSCMSCHESKDTSNECATCHLPDDDLLPLSHTPNFSRTHGELARFAAMTIDADKTCQTCHNDDFCQDCHEGDNLDRLTHPVNFAFSHALEAQANEKTCVTCHTDRQFCIECHQENFVLPGSHVPGWANTRDGGLHKYEAENDLETCMSCHEQNAARICQPCHGGLN